ncbi:MAG: GHKL domain-containing protein [Desulfamplus sp.]|nr:GHKL domain-containing protein [Desulfamplus sp.]
MEKALQKTESNSQKGDSQSQRSESHSQNNESKTDKSYYRTLSRNIMFTVIIVSFMPLIFVAGVLFIQFTTTYTAKTTAHLDTLVKKHRQNIDVFLNERQNNINQLAAMSTFENLSDHAFLERQLAILQREYGEVFTDLAVLNDQGEQIAYAGPFGLEGAHYKDAEWFKVAIKQPHYISDVFLGMRGFPHFTVTTRQFKDGKPWILRTSVHFQAFTDLVENIRIGKTGVAFILNQNGEFQTHTSLKIENPKKLYQKMLPTKIEFEAKLPENIDDKGSFTESDVDKKSNSTQSKRNSVESRDRRELSIEHRHIGNTLYVATMLQNKEWVLIFQQDAGDAFADLNRIRLTALIAFTVGGIAIIAMAMILSQRMVARIVKSEGEKEMMNQQVIEHGRLAALGEMAAGIAHEINNPVAIMVEEAGWIKDLLAEEEFQKSENLEEFTRALDQIRKQGLRCRDITHKLLSFARPAESGNHIININEMIAETVNLFAHEAKFSNITFEQHFKQNNLQFMASQTEIQQILFNLINNAMDAMKDIGGKILISTSKEDKMVKINVEDNGSGISQEHLARIFDPFFTTKPVGKGTGLGLYICYGIINKLGGNITVKSALNEGTVFTISVPAIEDQE